MIMTRRVLRCCLALLSAVPAGINIAAAQEPVPVPTVVIYPRDIVTKEMLGVASMLPPVPSSSYYMTQDEIVGKMARMTLLPNRPIPIVALITPRLFQTGARVRIVFNADGINASAMGTALEAGSLGDRIRVRNADSNLIVSGRVESDGTVSVGGE